MIPQEKKNSLKTKIKNTIAVDTAVDLSIKDLAISTLKESSNFDLQISYQLKEGKISTDTFTIRGEITDSQRTLSKSIYDGIVGSFKDQDNGKITVKVSSSSKAWEI